MEKLTTGTKPWQPNFMITVEGADITDELRENLVSLNLTDNGGSTKQSDQISFAVASETLVLPPKGVKIYISLGFGEELVDKGGYVVDALASGASSGSHRIVQVTARAFSKTNARGHSALQSQKTRSWSDVSLGDIAKTISTEHQLEIGIPDELASIRVQHVDQLGESDMNLLTRLAENYGAVSKVSHDYWLISPRNATTSISGKPIAKQVITRDMVDSWSYQENSNTPDSSSSGGGTYVITYNDLTDGGKVKTIKVGSGEPVIQYPYPQPNLQSAKEIAASFSSTAPKKLKSMSLSMMATPGLMELTAQCIITTSGFGEKEDRDWKISRLNMNLSPQGFALSLELE